MPNEFIARNGITSLGNIIVSGSITATGAITISGSIASASFATTAATASSADNLLVRSTLTAQTLVVQTITSSVDFVTGSTRFGSTGSNTHQFTGSVSVTGSLTTNGAGTFTNIYTTGNAGIATNSTQTITNGISLTIGDSATQHQPYIALRRNSTGGYWAGINWYDQTTRKSFIEENSNFDLRFGTSNALSMIISSSGSVGIGTSNPLYKLHVEDDSARVYIRATGSGGDAGIFMKASSSFAGGWTVKDDGNRNFWIYSDYANITRLYIDSIGAIGIGVTPTSGWGSSTKVVQIGSGSLYNDSFNNTLIATNAYFNGSNNIHIATGPALRYYQEISNGDHYFQVAPSKVSGSSVAYTSSLYIKNNGNIGVNTTSPLVKLHVIGGNENGIRSIVGGTFSPIQFSGDNNITSGSINAYNGIIAIGRTTSAGTGLLPDVAINSSGNVGIGTTNPSVVFNVSDPNHGIGIAYRGSSALPSIAGLFTDTGVSGGSGYGDLLVKARTDYGGFYGVNFYTAASDNVPVLRMRVQSDGVLSLLSGQLKFPATQNPSSDANTLDDYEEGTINITTLTDGSATLTQFVDNRTLSYTKIGNRVYVNGNIYNQSISGTWSNPLRIPLPFTAASGDGRNRSYGAAALYNWGSTSDNIYLIEAGGTYASLVSAGSGGTWGTITTSSGFTAVVNFSYITA